MGGDWDALSARSPMALRKKAGTWIKIADLGPIMRAMV